MTLRLPSILIVLLVVIASNFVSCRQNSPQGNAEDKDCVPRSQLSSLRLLIASGVGDLKEMDAMLKAGADPNVSDRLGTPVVAAAASGSSEAVKLLLDKGANVNAIDFSGYSPLMLASLNGQSEIVRLLISRGADVNASSYPLINGKRNSRFTALLIAKGKKYDEIAKMLEEAGAKE